MAVFTGAWLLAVIVGFGLATSLEAMSHHGGHNSPSNWTLTEPENCPYNDTTTHVCSRLDMYVAPCISITCCEWMSEHEDSAEPEDFMDTGDFRDDTNGAECTAICFVASFCSFYHCFPECCEGYRLDNFGRCQNHTNDVECKNGGSKMRTYDGFDYCHCAPGFRGRLCEQPVCECRNGGICEIVYGQPRCECPHGYYGKHCEQHVCGITCYNGGHCVSDGSKEVCNCSAPYVGMYCETEHHQSPECPAPKSHYPAESCFTECERDADCYGEQNCCQDGCQRRCKRPRTTTCKKDGKYFAVGEVYRKDDCMTCMCLESGMFACNGTAMCPEVMCIPGYEPVKKPGHCCPVCSDTPNSGANIRCPDYTVRIEVPEDSSAVKLTTDNTGVMARNDRNEPPRVWFEPEYLRHCRCRYPYRSPMFVSAYTRDSYNGESKCQLQVEVVDHTPPVFKNCPQTIFAWEGDRVTWETPVATDNVGIVARNATRGLRNQRLRANVYMVEYRFTDYDQNTAYCRFNVSVHRSDTPWNQLPEQLRQRTVETDCKEMQIGMIIGPIIGAVGIFALIVAIALWLRMRRHGNHPCRSGRPLPPAPASSGNTHGRFDNNIYHLPTDAKLMTPPPYSLPSNPPPYSQPGGGSMKEGEYAYIAPPQYTETDGKSQTSGYANPDYESLKSEA